MPKNKDVQPLWPTTMRQRFSDGRLLGTDGSVWLYRAMRMAPVADARSPQEALAASVPLMDAIEELASLAQIRVARRSAARGAYRQVHILMVNVPRLFTPNEDNPIADYLTESFPHTAVDRRLLMIGVRLIPNIGGVSGMKGAVNSVVDTLVNGEAPMSDFERDRLAIDALLARSGMTTPTNDDFRLANAWWNHGRFPDTPILVHDDHLHIFTTGEAAKASADAGRTDCDHWPESAGHHAVSFTAVQDYEMEFVKSSSVAAQWVSPMIDEGACAISIRARLEPSKVTRNELRKRKKQYLDDVNERAQSGKMERAEQDELLNQISEIEGVYANGGTPTLIDCSTIVAFSGKVGDINEVGRNSGIILNLMLNRQDAAMAETMLCSNVRANPHLHDLPSQMIACSGLPSLSLVGDRTGALVGFTERDRQPAYLSPTAAANEDLLPLMVVVGQSGSGKTMDLLWKADQIARIPNSYGQRTPVVIVDPKALTLDTRVPTPSGWSTIGDLEVGDQVFGRDGQACNVTHKSRVFSAQETTLYEITLNDGRTIRADANHQWPIYDSDARSRLDKASPAEITAWKANHLALARRIESLIAEYSDGDRIDGGALLSLIKSNRVTTWRDQYALAREMRSAGVASNPQGDRTYWPTIVALKAIVEVISRDADTAFGRTLTTAEIIDFGVDAGDRAQFALPGHDRIASLPAGMTAPRTARFNYISEIREIPAEPAQCVRVDSVDHTYLVGDFVVTHNTGSDHTSAVLNSGGQVFSLDSLAQADGIFDPMRFAKKIEVGVELAASMLMSVNPWGTMKADYETPLIRALSYGAQNGATCIGQALIIARDAGQAPPDMAARVFDYAESSPMFRACVGINPQGAALRMAEGITLIKVGDANLDLPEPGSIENASIQQRTALALVRMMVFGSAMALTGREGAVMLDEAWVFLGAGRSEVERLGRLARSQGVLPILFTQRITDATKAGLSGYISRGLILAIQDEAEALAACQLFNLEPTPQRIARLTAKASIGGTTSGALSAPNWHSMRALRDQEGKVVRGSIGIYVDLDGRAVPVEIDIPPVFLARSSTNPEDIRRRLASEEAAALHSHQAQIATEIREAAMPPAFQPPLTPQPVYPPTSPPADDGWGRTTVPANLPPVYRAPQQFEPPPPGQPAPVYVPPALPEPTPIPAAAPAAATEDNDPWNTSGGW